MSLGVYGVFMIAGILAIQFFFSTRNSLYWGAIVPIAYIIFLTWMLTTNRIESTLGFFLYLALGIFFLSLEWRGGRKYLKEKRQKELDKMKTYEMS